MSDCNCWASLLLRSAGFCATMKVDCTRNAMAGDVPQRAPLLHHDRACVAADMFVAAIGWRVGSSVDNVVVVARQAVIAVRVRLCKYRGTRFGIHMSTLRRMVTQPAVIATSGPRRGLPRIGLVTRNWSVTGHVTTMPSAHPISLRAPLQVNGGKDRVRYQSAIERFRK
ncbi:hypothetical protein XAB3213_680014 [Xanthomonas citri pv. bilvae]|nr:hypothetical protein XAB3213_680014 [Xanthomonas citri pv. bilvae]